MENMEKLENLKVVREKSGNLKVIKEKSGTMYSCLWCATVIDNKHRVENHSSVADSSKQQFADVCAQDKV